MSLFPKFLTRYQLKIAGAFIILSAVAFAVMTVWNSYKIEMQRADYTAEELEKFRLNYQVTENLIAELELIHEATNTKPRPIKVAVTPRRSRHAWYKARTVYSAVEGLKRRKGLSRASLIHYTKQDITPANVYDSLQHLLTEIRIVSESYGVKETPAPASTLRVVFPTDVYHNLDRIAHMISGIDDRAVSPSHVYQVASIIVLDLEKIRAAKGITTPIKMPPHPKGKRPRDVYNAGFILTKKLKQLAEKPGYKIPGGVVPLTKYGGKLIPEDVIDVLANNMADIEAISFSVGDNSPTQIPPFALGKTPSDVYGKVNEAILLVESLL